MQVQNTLLTVRPHQPIPKERREPIVMEMYVSAFPVWVLQFDTGGQRSHLPVHLAFEWPLDLCVVLIIRKILMHWIVLMVQMLTHLIV